MDELIALERGFWDASSRADGGYYRDNCAEDALFVFFFGTLDREACAQTIDENDTPWERYKLDDVHTIAVGKGVAILSYKATARHEGSAEDVSMAVSSVYVRESTAWRLVLHQQTPLTA